jgi:DivIVA domain-containing protein
VLHLLLYGVLAIALAGALFAVAARFLPAGEQIAPAVRDEPPWELPPEEAMRPEDVDAVRLPVALRGYRFAETDLLLDRLAGELRARDAEIARLRGGAGSLDLPPQVGPVEVEIVPDEHLEEELAVEEALAEPAPEPAPDEPPPDPEPEPAPDEPPPDPEPVPDSAQSYPPPAEPHPDYAHPPQQPADPAEHWTAAAPPWAVPVSTAVAEPAAEPDASDDPEPDGDHGARRRQRRRRRRA